MRRVLDSAVMLAKTRSLHDTIVACATPPGSGAIGIVRLSGPAAREIGRTLSPRPEPVTSHLMVHTTIHAQDGRVLDDGLVVEMHAPHSYTGEDSVELHLHGSIAVTQAVIDACIAGGARMAEPGEYTLRAFLNGRLDLVQAEAVADLIAARSDLQRDVAARHLEGELSRQLHALLTPLETILANWRAHLDFPEQTGDGGVTADQAAKIDDVGCKIQSIASNSRGKLRSGLRVVLCGAPNAGKSTLLNAWAGEERVIVDSDPGTTRDPVEVELFDGPIRWSVCDTAGIRGDAKGVEARGVTMAMDRIRSADVAVWLVAAPEPVWPGRDLDPLCGYATTRSRPPVPQRGGEAASARNARKGAERSAHYETGLAAVPMIVVGTKADLAPPLVRRMIETESRERRLKFLGWVSSRSGDGLAAIREAIVGGLMAPVDAGVPVLVRQRHIEAFANAGRAISNLQAAIREGLSLDLLCVELEEACGCLGAVLGRDVDQAVLDRIFSEFCLGK
ncbi:MAG: tRNA modification GTPase [Deltaproteobacteria bacterium]|nr:tRNA modification GTPase [Deltaproteobacteria bacterium]